MNDSHNSYKKLRTLVAETVAQSTSLAEIQELLTYLQTHCEECGLLLHEENRATAALCTDCYP